jgi:hypothetical protein
MPANVSLSPCARGRAMLASGVPAVMVEERHLNAAALQEGHSRAHAYLGCCYEPVVWLTSRQRSCLCFVGFEP